MAGKEQDAWIKRVLGIEPGSASGRPDLPTAQARWSASRGTVLSTLKQLEGAIRKLGDPLGDKAIILLRGISANLTAVPGDIRQVDELRRFLATDSIIDDAEVPNGFGIEVRIREPLMRALDEVGGALA